MANTISNMKMTNPIKGLVSKRKKRYTEDGYNLDLSYIDKNIIAMAFPAEKLVEAVYRNNIDDVRELLEKKHKGFYWIYNLCSERTYDYSKFQHRVSSYPFNDHNPPTIELIQAFCDDVQKFLSKDPKNVAAVHCKAGKGRTGTMICCYLLHVRRFTSAADALSFYGQKRTHDEKGVTIPSQRRYVEYYSRLLKSGRPYSEVKLSICELRLSPPPLLNSHQGSVCFSILDWHGKRLLEDSVLDVRRSQGNGDGQIVIKLDSCIPLSSDIQIQFKYKGVIKKDKLFHFWFNTYFVNEETEGNIPAEGDSSKLVYRLTKFELDDAHKDKQHKIFSPDFEVQVVLQRIPSDSYDARGISHHHNNHSSNNLHHVNHRNSQNNTPSVATLNSHPGAHTPSESSEASCTDSSTEEDGWESGELSTPTTAATANASSSLINYTSSHFFSSDFVSNTILPNDSGHFCALSVCGDEDSVAVGGVGGNEGEMSCVESDVMETKRAFVRHKDDRRRRRRSRSKTPQQQFKVKTASVKIVSGSPGNSCHQSRSQKLRWLSNMRSDPDFRETLAKSVVFRPPHSTESLDSTDFYSSLCDKQLSVGSPCKSAGDLSTGHQTNGQSVSVGRVDENCQRLVAKPLESHSIGFNVTPPSPPPSPPPASGSKVLPNPIVPDDDGDKIPSRNRGAPFTFRELRQELQYVIKHNASGKSAGGSRKSPDKVTMVKKKKKWGKT